MPQLSEAFGLSATGVASLVGLFYYGYSPFSLVAGACHGWTRLRTARKGRDTDRCGARNRRHRRDARSPPGNDQLASIGRFLQGAGGVFALIGAAYIATTNFPASRAATLIGATQMFGMAGGSAGQQVASSGPLIAAGDRVEHVLARDGRNRRPGDRRAALFLLLPRGPDGSARTLAAASRHARRAAYVVFRNPQSILCGMISGLLFIPTTIFDMTWGVRYLQDARGLDYGSAVMHSAMVPLGWIIGCPLLGFLSDRLGRRKPVITGGAIVLLFCLAWILYGDANMFPPYVVGTVAGLASGGAMLPYTVIKEANPPETSGTATGVVNFLNFTFSALLGPVFAWVLLTVSGGAERMGARALSSGVRSDACTASGWRSCWCSF